MTEPSDSTISDLLTRLERERQEADRRYNDALTAVNRALHPAPSLPDVPAAVESAALITLADAVRSRSSASFAARLGGVSAEEQERFNLRLVEQITQQATLLEQTRRALGALVGEMRSEADARLRFESLLVQCLMTVTAFVDTRDRALGGSELRDRLALVEERLMAVKRELSRRPASGTPGAAPASTEAFAGNVDASVYVGFEDRFRGVRDEIRARVEDYVPLLAQAGDVVDVGCGRGELLDLLRAHQVGARGVDANEAMAAQCRARGLDVEHGDALSFLERQPDGSIGGLVAVQVVEHFTPGYLVRFLETAYQKMRSGAPLILETLNPACWMAFFETYIRDLTHQRPLHPETLRYLVEASGFTRVDVQYRQPVREADRLDRVDETDVAAESAVGRLASALNAHADKLNARLFSSMDYVVIARR